MDEGDGYGYGYELRIRIKMIRWVTQNEAPVREAQKIYAALQIVFRDETARLNGAANLDLRLGLDLHAFGGIRASRWRDGFHFVTNHRQRYRTAYGEGFNQVTGLSGERLAGVFSVFLRGEYQHAPAVPSDHSAWLQATAQADLHRHPRSRRIPDHQPVSSDRGSIGVIFHDLKVSFGRKSVARSGGERPSSYE